MPSEKVTQQEKAECCAILKKAIKEAKPDYTPKMIRKVASSFYSMTTKSANEKGV
jgi:hypothetical protein